MSWSRFALILVVLAGTMLIWRCVPLFVLKGKELPEPISRSLGFIPPAVFAALVANDLIFPHMFADGIWPACIPLLATAVVAAVAVKTKSLLWCVVVGVVAYAFLDEVVPVLLSLLGA